jgi:FMN phosphatase YigB (HAD superfamily)
MFELLELYDAKKLIVTNATHEQTKEFGLVDLPYDMYSMEHKPNKTDTLYFTSLLEEFNLVVEDVLYFDHNLESVTAASSI